MMKRYIPPKADMLVLTTEAMLLTASVAEDKVVEEKSVRRVTIWDDMDVE